MARWEAIHIGLGHRVIYYSAISFLGFFFCLLFSLGPCCLVGFRCSIDQKISETARIYAGGCTYYRRYLINSRPILTLLTPKQHKSLRPASAPPHCPQILANKGVPSDCTYCLSVSVVDGVGFGVADEVSRDCHLYSEVAIAGV
jgi:hypothetical protein